MFDINNVICTNINRLLYEKSMKQIDLANYLGISKQVMSKMLNGSRIINASELKAISEFLSVSMEELTLIPENYVDPDEIKAFMGKVQTQEAKDGLKMIDKIADMILFYSRAREVENIMSETWEL